MNTPYRTTLRNRIASAAAEYAEICWTPGVHNSAVYVALTKLDPQRATKEEVDCIVGDDRLTAEWCDQCGRRVSDTITVGEAPDCESATATLCKPCWDQAHALWGEERIDAPSSH